LREEAPQTGWEEARKNLDLFSQHGMAGKATLPEAFPGNTRLQALGEVARGQAGGESLAAVTTSRSRDLAGLTEAVKKKVFLGPERAGDDVANAAVKAAEGRIEQLRNARTQKYAETVKDIPDLPDGAVALLYAELKRASGATQKTIEKEALDAVAATLLQPNKASKLVPQPDSLDKTRSGFKVTKANDPVSVEVPRLKTDPTAVAVDLKQLQRDLEVNDNMVGGVKLNHGEVIKAYKIVNDFLKTLSPKFAKAETDYQNFSRDVIEPMKVSAVGQVAGANPDPQKAVPASRINAIVDNQTPANIKTALQELQLGGSENGPSNIANQVAKALFEQRLNKGSTNLGKTLRGEPGSAASAQIKALVGEGGGNVPALDNGMKVSELLQGVQGAPGAQGVTKLPWLAAVPTPFSSSRIAITKSGRKADYTEIARILSQATPESLAELRRIAMFDPQVRKMLAAAAMVNPAIQSQSKEP
jgi:hypothetical protein